jgi:hypothetical protein
MIAFPTTTRTPIPCPAQPATPDEAQRLSRLLDYAEPWSENYFKLRKNLGAYRAGEFIDRITLEALLFPST